MSTIPVLNIYFPDFLAIFLDFFKHFLWWPRTLNTAHCSWFSECKTKVISKFICICLFVLKTNAIAKLSSKAILLHPSNPCRLLMEKLMEWVLKCYRNHNLFLFWDKTIEKPRFRRNPPLKIFASLETLFLFGQGPEVTWPEAASTKCITNPVNVATCNRLQLASNVVLLPQNSGM